MFCATDWAGMSTFDVPNVATLLQDLSTFNTLVDRIQQGYVNFMYLGRWLIHPEGASAHAGVPGGRRSRVIDTDELLLRRQQPGRHPVRRAHRALARLPRAPCTACPA